MRLYSRKTSATNEELFIERYDRLHRWSLQLTEHDHELAEDLLHDAFIQFTLSPVDLDAIQNLDSYLYGMLRNLHLSQVRRTTRQRFAQLSIVEYESALIGLRSVDPRTQIQVQQELRQICQYACARKESSRAGSVLILRFFHGYYPSEIVRILRSNRKAVDDRLRLARVEARVALERPESLAFLNTPNLPEVLPTRFARNHEDFLTELRRTIFTAQQHECLLPEQLQLYGASTQTAPTVDQLAHVVGCLRCLDEINRRLNLPLLAERFPPDTLGNEPRSKDGSGGPGDGGTAGGDGPRSVKKWKSDARDTFEHKPQELCISVNGYLQGSQKIASELSEQSLTVDLAEEINFVEIFSEQGIRLLLMNVHDAPPEGPGEQTVQVPLSDQRSLTLALRFTSPWPNLDVSYRDPALAQTGPVTRSEPSVEEGEARGTSGSVREGSPDPANPLARLIALKFRLSIWRLLLRPGTVTALFALVLMAVAVVVYQRRPAQPLSAADLLQRSGTAESAGAARSDEVSHRIINFETKSQAGEVRRQRIEIWHSGEKKVTARRLYDDHGVLIAGDWRRGDGVQTLYHHGAKPQLQFAPDRRHHSLVNAVNVWQLDPSAKDFSSLTGNEAVRVEETATTYVLTFDGPRRKNATEPSGKDDSSPADGTIIKASLVLRKTDLHATELTLVIADNNRVSHEFRFVEAGFEYKTTADVAPLVFEPDPELLSEKVKEEGSRMKPEVEALHPSSLSPLPSVGATSALEVEVLTLLHQAGADLGEQISVTRAGGGLTVQGLVDTDKRKAELLSALNLVSKNPAVRIEIKTVDEATVEAEENARRNPKTASPEEVVVDRVEADKDSMPAGPELRRYFGGDDEQARRFASRMINRSHEAMRHAGALKRLMNQFSTQELHKLAPEARAKWISLVRSHANAFQAETAALRQELQPIFFLSVSAASQQSVAINGDEELVGAISRLFDLGSVSDAKVRAAFSVSAIGSGATIGPQLWGLLKSTENLAAAIQKTH